MLFVCDCGFRFLYSGLKIVKKLIFSTIAIIALSQPLVTEEILNNVLVQIIQTLWIWTKPDQNYLKMLTVIRVLKWLANDRVAIDDGVRNFWPVLGHKGSLYFQAQTSFHGHGFVIFGFARVIFFIDYTFIVFTSRVFAIIIHNKSLVYYLAYTTIFRFYFVFDKF